MNKVYLVRHGENLANLTKEFSYRKVDYSLTPKGQLQAEQTAGYFKDKHVDRLFTSPLKRSIETAGIIGRALGLDPIPMENFREMNVGSLENLPPTAENWRFHNEIFVSWLMGDHNRSFPDGEDFIQVVRRMCSGIDQVLDGQEGRTILIVGHGGIFFCAMNELCPAVALTDLLGRENHNCSITEIDFRQVNHAWRGELVRWGDVSHLHGVAAEFVSAMLDTD